LLAEIELKSTSSFLPRCATAAAASLDLARSTMER
jgi:hypothetical protein